ncbi:hypothetical protein F7725_008388 [Dissostichus mawsoni]|uniref:Ig-like domain-containing protein n=1 Tax=Dissostichus mawsoni TaxID=36200 RepID=A0A7J5Y721_DISMA|nr:hypothetical protein F7725_008388 [Dissostichus mawsoni]
MNETLVFSHASAPLRAPCSGPPSLCWPPPPLSSYLGAAHDGLPADRYSPQGAAVSWEVDGTEVTEGVLSSSEEEKSGRYSSSSSLSLSQERWMSGELYSCKVLHHGHGQTQSLHRSQCGG